MTGKCSICVSKYREWIEEQHGNGKPLRDISKELEEQFGESISHVAISNHINKHMGRGDRVAELEARIRNLERWMSQALPGSPFVTWVPKLPRPGEVHHYDIRDRAAYLQTIPNAESLEAEVIAIRTGISARMDVEESQRDTRQKEQWAREKSERDRLAKIAHDKQELARKKASEEAKRLEIEEMRKSVEAYDNKEGTIT